MIATGRRQSLIGVVGGAESHGVAQAMVNS